MAKGLKAGENQREINKVLGREVSAVAMMAENAMHLQRIADIEQDLLSSRKAALEGWRDVAKYTHYQLKAVEVDLGGEINVNGLTDEQLTKGLEALARGEEG